MYVEKLSVIEQRQSKWHQEFPTFSEPPARLKMMNELSEAVAQPKTVDSRAPGRVSAEHEADSQPATNLGQPATTAPRGPRREFGQPGGPSDTRRAMIDELKSVLSSAKSSKSKTNAGIVGRRSAAVEMGPTPVPEASNAFEAPAVREKILRVPSSPSSGVPSKLMELNREFLTEFRKLRKSDS